MSSSSYLRICCRTYEFVDLFHFFTTERHCVKECNNNIIIRIPSWMCPNTWYFGLTLCWIVSNSCRHPALPPCLHKSPWPRGGPWVMRRSTPSGIRSHLSRHGWPLGRLKPQSQNSGCLINTTEKTKGDINYLIITTVYTRHSSLGRGQVSLLQGWVCTIQDTWGHIRKCVLKQMCLACQGGGLEGSLYATMK